MQVQMRKRDGSGMRKTGPMVVLAGECGGVPWPGSGWTAL